MFANHRFARHLAITLALVLVLFGCLPLAARATGEGSEGFQTTEGSQTTEGFEELRKAARPSTAGDLQVIGTQLCDSQGEAVVLRGASTHGLQWYPQYVNDELFGQLATEWDCNLVRLAMYSKDYCEGKNKEEILKTLHRGIDACIANDMYVLVDWHILEDSDPNENIEQAKAFFDQISREYAGVPNLIYEICNEPNGETTWADVKAYSEQVIPVIRANSPHAVIIVGTTTYDRDLKIAFRNPLEFDNIMYTLHFYVATHREDLQGELLDALDAGLPVFITECGLSEASGDGQVDFDSAVTWFNILHEHQLSFVIWSLSNKAETSAFIKPTSNATTHLDDSDLTPVGLWSRSLIQGADPASIPLPDLDAQGQLIKTSPDWMDKLDGPGIRSAQAWPYLAGGSLAIALLATVLPLLMRGGSHDKTKTYDEFVHATRAKVKGAPKLTSPLAPRIFIFLSSLFTLIYLAWRVCFSVPVENGWIAIAGNLILLVVEVFGFVESIIHYDSISGISEHPLPKIAPEEYPDVDIFISTYNEPCDLLRRTINGCNHLRYPDKRKVHVWLCDDNRRPEMRALAEQMGVGYFDRPDNKGAKAGNLNHALSLTSAPYIVTLDADMIVRSDFLL
ncbi:MAG: cellulase family glycosylhydrolase [Atopobiaceae bacterium]|nr:cellulase family glycosylhydrolase [Atopobiaceae bacterium]